MTSNRSNFSGKQSTFASSVIHPLVADAPTHHGDLLRHNRQPLFSLVLALALIASLTSACQPAAPAPTPAPYTLRLALLPILDALPIYAAQEQGYFAAQGVKVSFVPVASATERDQVMASGQADGMINDLVAVTLNNHDSVQVQVVRFAQRATSQQAEYRILVPSHSKLASPADLKGVEIGISKASVIEYVTQRLLEAEGLAPVDIKTIVVPKIPDRLALLSSGGLKAATLPEPFSSLAVSSGSRVLLDDSSHPDYGCSVISFRKDVIDKHPQAVAAFLKAVNQAAEDINKDHTRWSDVLVKYNLVPKPLIAGFKTPNFPTGGLPTEAQFKDVVDWALSQGLISKPVSYQDSINQAIGVMK